MKTYTPTTTSKLVKRFDDDLKSLLTEDLKYFRERNQFSTSNKQAVTNQQLKAA
ncbi:hypothetical protein [Mucilaginibacter glaciei]|uniref:Uncharacterized protein n=1 Tax=Mucilaginibacter glaciei TaxID=2772109 RepID=A0A926NS80_9SPHI|nr:hypothetical protein [Mucilaginibacter glaciei]MBD1392985.1 hypothetical protein [Mucilaginibacter glaciei]